MANNSDPTVIKKSKKSAPSIPLALPVDINDAKKLGDGEARFLVDTYYEIQTMRIRCNNRLKALQKAGKPIALMEHFFELFKKQERIVKRILHRWAKESTLGEWCLETIGIGPVIAAGLMAHIDISRAPKVSNVWSFAGLNPNMSWGKGQKRPFNAALKLLAWKLGQSIMKQSNKEGSLYGKIYKERKALEISRNEKGEFAEQAAAILKKRNYGKTTEAYKAYSQGKLSDAHIDARARRYAVKIFLSHYWECAWRLANPGKTPPQPWVIAHGGHVDYLKPEVSFPSPTILE